MLKQAKKLSFLLPIIAIAALLLILKRGQTKENYCPGAPMHDQNLLRKLYSRIHGLEALARHQVAQNNNIPYQTLELEKIDREINKTRQLINKILHDRTLPYHKQKLYNTGPYSHIIGLPSVPGTLYPWYHD